MKILLTAVNAKYIHSNPAIYSLRAYAKEYQNQISLAEYTINQRTEVILQELYKQHPDVLCFSVYIWNLSQIEEVAQEYHKLCPDVPIWVGGPEVSYEVTTFLQEHPYVQGIVIGEGEKTFRLLCRHYVEQGMKLEGIPGIAYRNGADIVINSDQEPLKMDEIPFVYQEVKQFEHKIIYYETSRGCPFRCSYCLSSIDKKLRFRSWELVEKELDYFLKNEVPQVKFVDRTFNANPEHAMKIWRYIHEHDTGKTNFHFEIAADLMTEEELELLAKMRPGLIQLEIGVQTTHPRTIEEIHRKMDLQQVHRMVNRIKEHHNIHQHLDLIAGLPYEDYETFQHSFDEVYGWKPEQLQLGFLKVLKGSYMYEQRQAYELVYTTKPPYEVMSTRWLSYADVLQIKKVEEMLEVYYNSGQYAKNIALFEKYFDSPFRMFLALGEYYEEKNLFAMSHTRNRRAEILLDFEQAYLQKYFDMGQEEAVFLYQDAVDALREMAVYDIYARENAKTRPGFAKDYTQWKDVTRHYCKKGKLSHLEYFQYHFDGSRSEKGYYVLFDYEKRNPLDEQAATEIIGGSL